MFDSKSEDKQKGRNPRMLSCLSYLVGPSEEVMLLIQSKQNSDPFNNEETIGESNIIQNRKKDSQ